MEILIRQRFSPYRHGGYSTYFDGAGDYLELPDAEHDFGSGDFTGVLVVA